MRHQIHGELLGLFAAAAATRLSAAQDPMTASNARNSPSRLVDCLVAQGLVQRDTDPHDRRYVTLGLTADGKHLNRRITL